MTAIYVRISRDQTQTGLGVQRQEADCRELIERKGWQPGEVYRDNDISATRSGGRVADRPAYQRLLEDIGAGRVCSVVAWDLDRMFRDPLEAEQFWLACERAGLRHVATVADDVDVTTGEGIMVARIKAAVAAEETRRMSRRIRRKHQEIAESGRPHTGIRCFGWEPDGMTQRPTEVAVIREAADRVLAGESFRSIVLDLNDRGVRTAGDTPWSTTKLQRVLRAPRVAGYRAHGDELYPGTWDPILPPETWRLLRSIRSAEGRPKSYRTYLLSGLVVCECGEGMQYRRRAKATTLECITARQSPHKHGCGCVIRAEPVEREVWSWTVATLEAGENRARIAALVEDGGEDPGDLLDALRACESRLRELRERLADGTLDTEDFVVARDRLRERMDELRRQVSVLEGPVLGSLPDDLDTLALGQKRELVATVLGGYVTIRRAYRRGGRVDLTRIVLPSHGDGTCDT